MPANETQPQPNHSEFKPRDLSMDWTEKFIDQVLRRRRDDPDYEILSVCCEFGYIAGAEVARAHAKDAGDATCEERWAKALKELDSQLAHFKAEVNVLVEDGLLSYPGRTPATGAVSTRLRPVHLAGARSPRRHRWVMLRPRRSSLYVTTRSTRPRRRSFNSRSSSGRESSLPEILST